MLLIKRKKTYYHISLTLITTSCHNLMIQIQYSVNITFNKHSFCGAILFWHIYLLFKMIKKILTLKTNKMTQLTKGKNGNGGAPSLKNDFFTSNFFTPRLFDIESNLFDVGMTSPLANIAETNKEYKVEISVPGMKRDDFKVDIENGVLTVTSEKEEEKKEEDKNYKRREFSYSSFSRTFSLPENVNENKISAKYDNGILQVTIPKKEATEQKPKKAIKVS